VIAAIVITLTLVIGLTAGVASGQPFLAVALAVGLAVGYAAAFLTVPALRLGRRGTTGAAISDATTGWAEFHRELTRARRFDGSFALVRLNSAAAAGDDANAIRDQIAGVTRRIDRVWVDGGQILLLLPEATTAAVEAAIGRIRPVVPEAVVADPGIAVFPRHGITSESLIAAAYGAGVEDVPTPITTARSDLRGPSVTDAAMGVELLGAGERASSGG
jgi:hypothetical protein